MENKYVPGVCNIGPKEIENRKRFGYLGFILTIFTIAIILLLNIPSILRIVIFLPIFLTTISFLQAKFHFCAEFAMTGVFNFSDKLRKTESIVQQEFRKQDQAKALKILGISLLISTILTIIFILL